MDFEKMKREEAALEAQFNGATEVKEEETPVTDQSTFEPTNVAVESVYYDDIEETITPKAQVEQEEKSSWKHRFTTYKSSTDVTIHNLRTDLAGLRVQLNERDSKISTLNGDLARLREEFNQEQDPFEGVFDKSDEDIIGEDAIKIIKKAYAAKQPQANPELEAMREEMAAMRESKRVADEQALKNLNTDSLAQLKAKLTNVVPQWSTIDTEPEFSNFLNEVDQYSGVPRMNFFTSAIQDRDVGRVASFYNEYNSQKPKSRAEILSSKVGVTGSGASESTPTGRDSQKKIYSIDEYTNFMASRNSGKLKMTRQEANIIEKRFDQAFQEGRVR